MVRLIIVAIIAIAVTTFTGCKKDDVAPGKAANHSKAVMDSGGPDVPPQLPPPPHP